MGDAVRKPWETAVPVGQANRRRASESLNDVPHRPRLASYPADRLRDLYGSLSTRLGIIEPEYTAERTSFFPSIHSTLNHILIVDLLYLERLERKAEAYRDPGDELYGDLPGLTRAQGAADRRLIGFCAALRGPDLDAEVTLFRRDGVKIDRVGAVLPHLFVHQIHHRGQVHAMLAGSAVAPPQLDEFFLAEDAPLRRAELEALGLDSA